MSAGRGTSRRAVLLAGGSAALAVALPGCRSAEPEPPPPAPVPPDPDDALREAAVAREQALLLAYDAAVLIDPSLAPRLLPLRAHHEDHLGAVSPPPPSPVPGGRPSTPSPSASPLSTPPAADAAPPASDVSPLVSLAEAERRASAEHGTDCLLAADRELAAVLASLSACEQSHLVALA